MKIQGPNPELVELEIIGDEILKSLDMAPKNSIFRATVGYISDSAVKSFRKSLERIINEGGTVEIIVGLNQVSKRSIAALENLYNICNGIGVYVFWNPDINVTFHPKCYLLKNPKDDKLCIWIGSSNFTRQGLFSNYECNIHLVLESQKDKILIKQFEDYYAKLRESIYCHALADAKIKKLKGLKNIPRGEKPISLTPQISNDIKIIFGINESLTLPNNAFVMTLSKNDIDAKRFEPYFLIPIAALHVNKAFWGWPLPVTDKSKYPSKDIKASISVKNKITVENRRIYYVESRKELRFVSKKIYNLGLTFLGSIIMIIKNNDSYNIEVIGKNDYRFSALLKHTTQAASQQKLWGYI